MQGVQGRRLCALMLGGLAAAEAVKAQSTERVSVDSAGVQGNGFSDSASITAEGRYVAFRSDATNLVANDSNGQVDIFVHDRQTGRTMRVSVGSAGEEANLGSDNPSISADGRFIAFRSNADNLIPGDPVNTPLAAVSVGLVDGEIMVDLDYTEDSRAQVGLNLVMDTEGRFIEVQATAEGDPFSKIEFVKMLEAGARSIKQIAVLQAAALEAARS